MSYNYIKTRCEEIAYDLGVTLRVGTVENLSLFASSKEEEVIWLVFRPYTSSFQNNRIIKNIAFWIFFVKRDTISSLPTDSFALVSEMENRCDRFTIALKDSIEYTLQSRNLDPVYKISAKNIYTGVMASYTLQIPDNVEYC